MPNPENDCLFQKAILWAASETEVDDDTNEPKVAAAVEIDVRWQNVQREIPDGNGNIISVIAQVVVDQDITNGSIMWEGTLETVATPPVELKKVVAFSSTPDIKNTVSRRTVMLARFSDSLPTITS